MDSHRLILFNIRTCKNPILFKAKNISQSVTPMNQTRSRNWFYVLSYTMISIVVLGLITWVSETFFPKTSSELTPRDDALSARFISGSRPVSNFRDTPKNALLTPTKEKITFVLDRDIKLGKSIIVYRGLDENAKFKMDVAVLELDPKAFYRYRIPIHAAKKGFKLAGQNFRLIAARSCKNRTAQNLYPGRPGRRHLRPYCRPVCDTYDI